MNNDILGNEERLIKVPKGNLRAYDLQVSISDDEKKRLEEVMRNDPGSVILHVERIPRTDNYLVLRGQEYLEISKSLEEWEAFWCYQIPDVLDDLQKQHYALTGLALNVQLEDSVLMEIAARHKKVLEELAHRRKVAHLKAGKNKRSTDTDETEMGKPGSTIDQLAEIYPIGKDRLKKSIAVQEGDPEGWEKGKDTKSVNAMYNEMKAKENGHTELYSLLGTLKKEIKLVHSRFGKLEPALIGTLKEADSKTKELALEVLALADELVERITDRAGQMKTALPSRLRRKKSA